MAQKQKEKKDNSLRSSHYQQGEIVKKKEFKAKKGSHYATE